MLQQKNINFEEIELLPFAFDPKNQASRETHVIHPAVITGRFNMKSSKPECATIVLSFNEMGECPPAIEWNLTIIRGTRLNFRVEVSEVSEYTKSENFAFARASNIVRSFDLLADGKGPTIKYIIDETNTELWKNVLDSLGIEPTEKEKKLKAFEVVEDYPISLAGLSPKTKEIAICCWYEGNNIGKTADIIIENLNYKD